MLNFAALFDDLAAIGLPSWRDSLEPILRQKLADGAHGKLAEWRETLAMLPRIEPSPAQLDTPAVTAGPINFPEEAGAEVRRLLLRLRPWRKGPFRIGGILIDSEWRSDWKWDRLKDAISPLKQRSVLDVGCGNGYYALRMRGDGARTVIGIDPTLLYAAQFQAVCHWMKPEPVHVLPLRLHELPQEGACFDTTFSMGVLYHQRSPLDHLRALRKTLKTGGELVLETLVLPGTVAEARAPDGRYARMQNVWLLPTQPELENWLRAAGFVDLRTVDITQTTPDEQRTTEWMPFESLAEALDPADPSRTIEGWPGPRRALLICRNPGDGDSPRLPT